MPKIDNKTIVKSFQAQTGIRQTDLKKLSRKLGLSGINDKMGPIKSKRVIKDLFDEAEKQGYNLKKGPSKNIKERMRGVFEHSQEQVIEAKNPKTDINQNERLSMIQKLRQKYSTMVSGAKNQPQISATGKNAIFSGAMLGKTSQTNQQKQANITKTEKQESTLLTMDAQNRTNPAETQEIDMDAPAGFEMNKPA